MKILLTWMLPDTEVTRMVVTKVGNTDILSFSDRLSSFGNNVDRLVNDLDDNKYGNS